MSLNMSANELKWVDEQIEAIKPSRDGVSKSSINNLKDPFIFLKVEKKELVAGAKTSRTPRSNNGTSSNITTVSKKTTYFNLSAIINKSALINGKWYKEMDKVGKYTLSEVNRSTITLKSKGKKLHLSTATKNRTLKYKNN